MSGRTTVTQGHQHRFRNLTDRLIPGNGTHRHSFNGITQITNGHRHSYSGITGNAINGQGARHFHRFRQVSRIANGHRHILSGRTSVPIRVSGSSKHRHSIIIESIKQKWCWRIFNILDLNSLLQRRVFWRYASQSHNLGGSNPTAKMPSTIITGSDSGDLNNSLGLSFLFSPDRSRR